MGQCVKCIEAPRNIFGGKFPIVLELLSTYEMGHIYEDDLYSEEEVLVEVIRVGGAVYCGQ